MSRGNYSGLRHDSLGASATADLESLVRQAKSYDKSTFNKECFRLLGLWHIELDNVAEQLETDVESIRLVVWQDERVAEGANVAVKGLMIENDIVEFNPLSDTDFIDLGMTSLKDTVGVVFITEGDISDDVNPAIFVPASQTHVLHISSQVVTKPA